MEKKVETKVIVSGRVQGVFFRVQTKNTADQLGLKGYVKNLPNGSVEAVFQGEQMTIEKMVAWCNKGPAAARVDHVLVHPTAATSIFNTFEIRY
ncbi:MAG: acylphosphatase [Proteobacteria bacterium]|nr:acylphosphatase [Pseudomonadota bacterium]MBU1583225.1 acylphosphatase [Pseudomonadota bacterium]MBU2454446.1 acylphosphatase [Pseudomonadota bacterium]MBU2631592.1 acylphosphatase [Pseudomonadota bacterium]